MINTCSFVPNEQVLIASGFSIFSDWLHKGEKKFEMGLRVFSLSLPKSFLPKM